MKPNTILTVLAIATSFAAMPAHAATCSFSNTVAITGINLVNPDGSAGAALAIPDLNPTACIVADGNISGNIPVGDNIGTSGEGVLNGGAKKNTDPIFDPYFLPPSNPSTGIELNTFYLPGGESTYPQEKLVNGVDPGWIKLYSTDGGYGVNPTLGNLSLVISELMTINVKSNDATKTSGTWSIELEPDIIAQVQSVLGRNAFDHLAFILKSSTKSIVYDFDFNVYAQYFASQGYGVPFDYVTPYDFSGTWEMTDFINPTDNSQQELSHLEIWARDPDAQQDIPEPASLALLGLGLAGLGLSRRKNKQQ